ncbi:MAG: hypothetical protein IKB51_04470 [Clostridia bacterium]|nr:hypothetical protein [Clostridia bacterium]
MEKTISADSEIIAKIYKNVKMGVDSVTKLLPKVSDEEFKTKLTDQLNGYEEYAAKAKALLCNRGEEAKEETPMVKFWSSVGIAMNTMMDASSSHIAEMIIEGSTMGITDTTRIINEYEGKPECKEAVELARDIVAFEQKNIEVMKNYL